MSIELPRLEPFNDRPQTWQAFLSSFTALWGRVQIWWQKIVEVIEAHELVQDGILENLQTTDATLTLATQELQATQTTLAATVASLAGTQSDVGSLDATVSDVNGRVGDLESASGGFVLKNQTPLWVLPTGTLSRASFASYTAPTISALYTQAEVQALADHLQLVSRTLAALVTDLITSSEVLKD